MGSVEEYIDQTREQERLKQTQLQTMQQLNYKLQERIDYLELPWHKKVKIYVVNKVKSN